MSFVYGSPAWAAYCPWHQAYDFDYMYSYSAQPQPWSWSQHGDRHPMLGEDHGGIHIYENCKYCWQPLVATSDPGTNYCPSCGRFQPHRI